jgi:tetratricopeptide (TPR) repeat protein
MHTLTIRRYKSSKRNLLLVMSLALALGASSFTLSARVEAANGQLSRADKLAIVDKLLNKAKASKGCAFAREAAKDHFLGKMKAAIMYCDLALKQDSKLGVAYLIKGIVHDDLEQPEDVVAELTKAIQLEPACGDAYFYELRSVNYSLINNLDAALADANKAISLSSKPGCYYNMRANIYTKMHKYDLALASFATAVKMLPENDRVWSSRAACYVAMQHYKEALADYSEAIRLHPTSATYKSRALVYDKLGDKSLAHKDRAMSKNKDLD